MSVVLEPLPGYRDEDIVASLEEAGVNEINVLAPGYISVRATRAALKMVEEIADIHIKPRKQLRVSAKRSALGKPI